MSEAPSLSDRIAAQLARLAELDLAAAEKAHAKLMAAEDAAEIAELGRTYQRLARSCRQTIALEAKLARERAADAARSPRPRPPEPPHEGLRDVTPPQRAHIERAAEAVERWAEAERPDWDELDQAEVYDILIDMAADEAFLDMPVEALVARIRELMDVDPDDDRFNDGGPNDGGPDGGDAAARPPVPIPDTG